MGQKMDRVLKEHRVWYARFLKYQRGTPEQAMGNPYHVALQVAHLDHDPENPDPRLAALCPSCHGRHDWAYHQRRQEVDVEWMKHWMLLKRRGRS